MSEVEKSIAEIGVYQQLMELGSQYGLEDSADFSTAAQIFADEAALIVQMREQIAQEGMTVERQVRTGMIYQAHPLLAELPRHVQCANKTLETIGEIIGKRGSRREAKGKLDSFRLKA